MAKVSTGPSMKSRLRTLAPQMMSSLASNMGPSTGPMGMGLRGAASAMNIINNRGLGREPMDPVLGPGTRDPMTPGTGGVSRDPMEPMGLGSGGPAVGAGGPNIATGSTPPTFGFTGPFRNPSGGFGRGGNTGIAGGLRGGLGFGAGGPAVGMGAGGGSMSRPVGDFEPYQPMGGGNIWQAYNQLARGGTPPSPQRRQLFY